MFEGRSASAYMKIAEFAYSHERGTPPLAANNLAPDWKLPKVTGGTMSSFIEHLDSM